MESMEKNVIQEAVQEEAEGKIWLPQGKEVKMEELRKRYKEIDGKIYEVATSIQEDDETEKEFDFIFRKPEFQSGQYNPRPGQPHFH